MAPALTPCRQCKHPVSRDAAACPQCGADQPALSAAWRALIRLTAPGTLTAFGLLYILATCTGPQPPRSPPPTPAQRLAACGADMQCVAQALTPRTAEACKRRIEALAAYGVRWPTGGPDFVVAQWLDDAHTLVALAGAGVELKNGYGGWFRRRYSCMYNLTTDRADYAVVSEGP